MPEKKHLTCIGCPMCCPLELTIVAGEIREISGNNCKRGEEYARQEFTAPCRVVCTTVDCSSGIWPRLPVKTAAAVPKNKVQSVTRALHSLKIEAPVRMGQLIFSNVADTGIDVIATRSLPQKEPADQSL